MKDKSMILILGLMTAFAGCTGDEVQPTQLDSWQTEESENEGTPEQIGLSHEATQTFGTIVPDATTPKVALTCATAASRNGSIAYVVEFGLEGEAVVKRGPAHYYREWLDSPEAPTRGPLVESEMPFDGTISHDHIDIQTPLFSVSFESTHPGYFRGETHLADHGVEELECWTPDFAPPFRYDGETGSCTNEDGERGLNQTGIIVLRETGFGECAELGGIQLNGHDFGYPVFQGLNLAGANLEGAGLHFALLENADLRGTSMLTLEFGYAWLTGEIDAHTRVIDECRKNDTELNCSA